MPARFEIIKKRLLFLKNILNEEPSSMIQRFVRLQFEKPKKGEWGAMCIENMKYLGIELTMEEIRALSKNRFMEILRKSIKEKALQYLLIKRGSKGKEIVYQNLKMAEYLLPNNESLSISEKRYIFAIRNRMVEIEVNFPQNKTETKCFCGETMNMNHIYSCKQLNNENIEVPYEAIFSEEIDKQKIVQERFKKNLDKMENKTKILHHGIPKGDPLHDYAVMEIN